MGRAYAARMKEIRDTHRILVGKYLIRITLKIKKEMDR
jgi:hypothetical protein